MNTSVDFFNDNECCYQVGLLRAHVVDVFIERWGLVDAPWRCWRVATDTRFPIFETRPFHAHLIDFGICSEIQNHQLLLNACEVNFRDRIIESPSTGI
jgi:hypothetical protein